MATRARTGRNGTQLNVWACQAPVLFALGVLSAVVVSSTERGAVLTRVLSELRSAGAIAARDLSVAFAASVFVPIAGPHRRPVAVVFATTVALGALTLLCQVSWLGEHF